MYWKIWFKQQLGKEGKVNNRKAEPAAFIKYVSEEDTK